MNHFIISLPQCACLGAPTSTHMWSQKKMLVIWYFRPLCGIRLRAHGGLFPLSHLAQVQDYVGTFKCFVPFRVVANDGKRLFPGSKL